MSENSPAGGTAAGSTANGAPNGPGSARPAAGSPGDELSALAAEYWEGLLAANPSYATFLGDRRFDDRIEDLSVEAENAQARTWKALLSRLDAVDLTDAPRDQVVTRDLLRETLTDALGQIDHRMVEWRYDQMDGIAAALLSTAPQINAPEPVHAESLAIRQRQVGVMVDAALDRFRAGVEAGRTPARIVVQRALNQIDAYLASPLEGDPFISFEGPPDWAGEGAWRDELRTITAEVVRPAFTRMAATLRDELLPVARDDDAPGLAALAEGSELYGFLIRSHTGLHLDPEEIHRIGLDEVARIDEQLAELGQSMFATSHLPEVFDRLRQDPALRYDPDRPEEPLEDARRCVAAAEAVMGDWFGRLPQAGCEVKAVPEVLAPDAPAAYYFPPAADGSRPGTYYVNTHDAGERNRFDTASVAYHEAIPGHHLQLAIAAELTGLPDFQRFSFGHTAFVEGWALYTERLADEMGLYLTDLDRVGMLINDAWRACRLVVDTGLHALGWTRQQAIDHMVAHMPVGVDEITTEVDRYLAIPGQALAYKIGQREILRLRDDARSALGDRFDLKGFHDAVLGSSTVSLPVLGAIVADWVGLQAVP